jgi:hypothetical protein
MDHTIEPVSSAHRPAVTVADGARRTDVISMALALEAELDTDHVTNDIKAASRAVVVPREIPANFVFAPGFLYADRRGLVGYPGLGLAPSELPPWKLRAKLEQALEKS